jgi:arylsulfatase A-like enzyme
MNVIWIVADTFRRDHLGCYGNPVIRTPALDALAARAVRFDRHYVAGFPTMPARADHATGRWTLSFMRWEPLPSDVTTLAQLLSAAGFHTAACVDTPFYLRGGMNYDRGFQTFFTIQSQEGSLTRLDARRGHESRDLKAWWRVEADRNAPRTITAAMHWLERHYKEDFFLYVDTWDPHEPWDAPPWYTELYWPDYDGEVIQPVYGHWHDTPGLTEEKVRKAHATYCGEITMVDTWIGRLLRTVENMGLGEKTALIFTSDHGFYFGEHGGLFGKMTYARQADGSLPTHRDAVAGWARSPLFEELVALPLLVSVPGVRTGGYAGLTSAIDVMPTVLDCLAQPIPGWVEGRSLLPAVHEGRAPGRDFVISTLPFANPDDAVNSVDNVSRKLVAPLVTTVTSAEWSFLYTPEPGGSELYHRPSDPRQAASVVSTHPGVARDHHRMLVEFMRETRLPRELAAPRQELRL